MHLEDWPDVSDWNLDPDEQELAGAMDLARSVCSTALGLRKAHQLRFRLPLASLTIADPAARSLAPFTGLIALPASVGFIPSLTSVFLRSLRSTATSYFERLGSRPHAPWILAPTRVGRRLRLNGARSSFGPTWD